MSQKPPFRLTELLIAIAIVGAVLVWAEQTAWREIKSLRAEMNVAQVDRLTAANQAEAERFVTDTNAALTRVQHFIFLSSLGWLLGGVVVLLLVYRRAIAPLQSNLEASRAIIERQEKLAALGVLAAGIAHEIRNPLTAIKVRLFSLKAVQPAGTSEHEDLEVIENEIGRLERIVRDFLQFARPAEPDLKPVPAAKFIRGVADFLAADLAKKLVVLKLELQTEDAIRADADKLKQVFINLIQNAAESMAAGGVVTLRVRRDKQSLLGRVGPVVVFEVADTGGGIPPEVQERLFDPFFTTKEAGTGLGLSISARIVEKHGGVIHYETQPNHGTTFSIVLPAGSDHEHQPS